MECKSSLKEQLFALEQKLLEPEIRTSKEELSNLLAETFLNLEVQGRYCTKMRILVK